MGLTWAGKPFPANVHLLMEPADSRALYGVTEVQEGDILHAAISFSPDGGATWQQRGVLTTSGSAEGRHIVPYTFAVRSAPLSTLFLAISNGYPGGMLADEVYLSIDGGQTFNDVGTSAVFQEFQLFYVGDGVLRLTNTSDASALSFSNDGGKTWSARPLPAPLTPAPGSLGITQVPDAPRCLLLTDANGVLWHSADAGLSWQQLATTNDPELKVTPYAPHTLLWIGDGHLRALDLPDVGPSLTPPVAAAGADGGSFFPETGHNLSALFQPYWQANGGLAQFGYPTTELLSEVNPADNHAYLVQYFERNRFEYHPEYAGTSSAILLGLLGDELTAQRRAAGEAPFNRVAPPADTSLRYFPETGHVLDARFRAYWEKNGGLAIYGYPISETFSEINPEDGRSYEVQYFERNRFEYHSEHTGTPYEVQLGLLGNTLLRQRGWRD